MVKKTENAKNIPSKLYPNFIKPISALNVFEIGVRNFL